MPHILITRPQGKGASLAEQLKQAGYQATLFPVLALNYLTPNSAQLTPLLNADKIIFISQDAVSALLALKPDINIKAQFYAVGEQTAEAVWQAFGVRAAVPKKHDSEGLLALKSLEQVQGQNIVLVKGEGGRPAIAQALKQRDAFLNSLVVYQRGPVEGKATDWLDHWQSIDVEGIVITSNAAVDAIFSQLSSKQLEWLKDCQFYVASDRICEHLKQHLNSANIHIAAGASDSAMFTCISQGNTMSENAKPTTSTEEKPTVAATKSTAKPTSPTASAKKEATVQPNNKHSISKTGSLALLISLIVASGEGYQFYQKLNSGQQTNQQVTQLAANNKLLNKELNELKATQHTLQQALRDSENQMQAELEKNTQQTKQQLESALQRAEQQAYSLNPKEVTSLQRMAEFKLWAEKDYQGASAVLTRLDDLLSEYPGTGAIRKAISQDLQTLNSVKSVPVEAIYLKIHGITEHIDELKFNAVSLPNVAKKTDQNALSEDVGEWQQNLINSWHQFSDNFIKIRQREGEAIEPLLTAQERHLVIQRLSLYLSQAQDALMTNQASIYFTAISQAMALVKDDFKQADPLTKSTLKALDELSKEQLQFAPEVKLQSTEQVKEWAQ